MGTVIEAIITFLLEVVLGKLFKFVQTIGLFWIKLFSRDSPDLKTLSEKYDASPWPWFLGFATVGGIIYWLTFA